MRRLFRWTFRLAMVLIVLAAIAAIVAQIVLWTEMPRRIIESSLSRLTGLRVHVASADVGWFGRTTLRDVSFALPLDEKPIVTAPRIEARHRWLPGVVWSGDPGIEAVRIDDADVRLEQDAAGRWTLQEAIDVIESAGRGRGREGAPGGGGLPAMPDLHLTISSLRVRTPDRPEIVYGPVVFTGKSDARVAYAITASVQDQLTAAGTIAPGANWAHPLDLSGQTHVSLLEPWGVRIPEAGFTARWTGAMRDGAFAGELQLADARWDVTSASGSVAISVRDGVVTARPSGLTLRSVPQVPGPVRIERGELSLDSSVARLETLSVLALDSSLTLSGTFDLHERAGDLVARIGGQQAGGSILYDARARLRLELPEHGVQRIAGSIDLQGDTPQGQIETTLDLALVGRLDEAAELTLAAPSLRVRRDGREITLDGFAARVEADESRIALTQLTLPGADEVQASAVFNRQSGAWDTSLDITALRAAGLLPEAVNLTLDARGDLSRVEDFAMEVLSDRLIFRAGGAYLPDRESPLDLAIFAQTPPTLSGALVPATQPNESAGEPPPVLTARLVAAGSIRPLGLTLEGDITAANLRHRGRAIEDAKIPIRGSFNGQHLSLVVPQFRFLDGDWSASATYARGDPAAVAKLQIHDVPLRRVSELLRWPFDTAGSFAGEVEAQVPSLDPLDAQVDGEWTLTGLQTPMLVSQDIHGRLRTRGGRVRLSDIEVRQDEARIVGDVAFNLDAEHRLAVKLRADRWPLALEGLPLVALLDGSIDAEIDVLERSARGTVSFDSDLLLPDRSPIGNAHVQMTLDRRTLDRIAMRGELAGGRWQGTATIPIDDLIDSRLRLSWTGVDLSQLDAAAWAVRAGVPATGQSESPVTAPTTAPVFAGQVDGEIEIAKNLTMRALEPMRLSIRVEAQAARFRNLPIGRTQLTAAFGRDRFIVENAVVGIAGGAIRPWLVVSNHDGRPFFHARATLENLSLDDIVHAVQPAAEPMPGLLNGSFTLVGYVNEPHRGSGDGVVTLTESDLVNFDVMTAIYNAMNLSTPTDAPRGEGVVRFRIEGQTLRFTSVEYFNRGAEILADGAVLDIWQLEKSPIRGNAVGIARPLRGSWGPLSDLDKILRAVQQGSVEVEVGGTLENPEVRPVPLPEMGAQLRRLLTGQMQRESGR
jgi:hypothetical protein